MGLDIYPLTDGTTDRRRLDFLQRVFNREAFSMLDRVGVKRGMSCLDLGCGTAEVAFELAQRVGPGGRVVGMDIDDARLEDAREYAQANGLSNLEFLVADIRTYDGTEKFDLAYSRLLLSHLSDPARVLDKMRRMLNPGGIVAIEDLDYSGYYCYPELPAFRRCVELLYEMKRAIGGSAEMGKELPVLFLDAGLSRVEVCHFQHVGLTGDIKRYLPSTVAGGMSDWIVTLGLTTADEMESILAELNEFADNPRTIMGAPRFSQVWGYAEDG